MLLDLLFTIRMWRRHAAVTAVMILTLSLGIGLTSAVLMVANSALLSPVPYPDAERLIWITEYNRRFDAEGVIGPDFADWRAQSNSLESIAAYGDEDAIIASGEVLESIRLVSVSSAFWHIAGSKMVTGRGFGPGERNAIVITQDLYERTFGSDTGILGRPVLLNGRTVEVVGVLPREFRFPLPLGGPMGEGVQVYALSPVEYEPQRRGGPMLSVRVIGKLKEGVSVETARAELETIQAGIARSNPGPFYDDTALRVAPLHGRITAGIRPALVFLIGTVSLVLIIACANISSLLLARATARRSEIAMRRALGAGKAQLMRQSLLEALMLGTVAGGTGLLFATWTAPLIAWLGSDAVPHVGALRIDLRVLVLTFAVSLAAAVLVAAAPVLLLRSDRLQFSLREASGATSSARVGRKRAALAILQIALATFTLAAGARLLTSYWKLEAYSEGWAPKSVLILNVGLDPRYAELAAQQRYMADMLDRLSSVPGVQFAGLSTTFMMGPAVIDGAEPEHPRPESSFTFVSSGYKGAAPVRVLKGRWLDDAESGDVVVVNQTFARLALGGRDPIGTRVRVPGRGSDKWATIVGMVADLTFSRFDERVTPKIFVPYVNSPILMGSTVMVRTIGDATAIGPVVQKSVLGIDPTQRVQRARTLDDSMSQSRAPLRFNMLLLLVLSVVALVLALAGTYAVMSYNLLQRSREIAVRLALGASVSAIRRKSVMHGLVIALTGSAIGAAAMLSLSSRMSVLVPGTLPTGVTESLLGAVILVIFAALLTSWTVARRVSGAEMTGALRLG